MSFHALRAQRFINELRNGSENILASIAALFAVLLMLAAPCFAQSRAPETGRTLSGIVVTPQNEVVQGASVRVRAASFMRQTTSADDGRFRLDAPHGQPLTLEISGTHISPLVLSIAETAAPEDLRVVVRYVVPPIHESIVIVDSALEPRIERRNEEVYTGTIFSRDDQLFDTLAAGINAGQHERGGKSLEISRFGVNMDHVRLKSSLKVLVDDVQ